MFIKTPEPYWLSPEAIKIVEEKYNATYMGPWTLRAQGGGWTENPVDVFHQPNFDESKGHGPYFGMFKKMLPDGSRPLFITNAESAFSEPITGILCDDGEVLVSRYRHDYVSKGDYFIDGGRDYIRCSHPGRLVEVKVESGAFSFEQNPIPSIPEPISFRGIHN